MIKTYKLHNFQSWKKARVRFHPGVNAITGASDCGKTALLRGLNWALTNKPGGDTYRSMWGGDTVSHITFSENNSIERGREGKTKNYYNYSINGEEPEQLKAFGAGVPDEVSTVANIGEVNQQYQMDSPFLLSSDTTPGKVAAWLNKAADLEVIDTTLSNIKRESKKVNLDLAVNQEQLDGIEVDLQELSFIDEADGSLHALEQLEQQINSFKNDKSVLAAHIAIIEEAEETKKEYADVIQHEKHIKELITLQGEIQQISDTCDSLSAAISYIEKKKASLKQYNDIITADDSISELVALYDDLQNDKKQLHKMNKAITDVKSNEQLLSKAKLELKEAESNLTVAMPSVCPLCDTKL